MPTTTITRPNKFVTTTNGKDPVTNTETDIDVETYKGLRDGKDGKMLGMLELSKTSKKG